MTIQGPVVRATVVSASLAGAALFACSSSSEPPVAAASAAAGASAAGSSGGMSSLGPDFASAELLGRPTDRSISVNVVPTVAVEVYLEVGTTQGTYATQSPSVICAANEPFVATVGGLTEDTAHHDRLRWRRPGDADFQAGPDRQFHTQRAPGQTFRFTMQADSHMDENSVVDLYHRTLANVLADAPDFHVDLGDTFMCEKHVTPLSATSPPAPDEPSLVSRYLYEREHFGLASHSVPLFLVNGNHDGELGYLLAGGGDDLATWATRARQRYFLNPTPDSFYTGDSTAQPHVGQRAAWYAWRWGDALFVTLDPFWNSTMKSSNDAWAVTLGKQQYDWLVQTLTSSTAKYKFVFLHNLVGGLDGQMRGGAEAAPFFEWGGANADGSPGFAQHRAGWDRPIHQVLVDTKVTAVFHGHDHLYSHQTLDGVVYQEVPQPSAKNSNNGATLASQYHYASGTALASAGHVRITVSPTGVKGEYVRAWLPASENATQVNGQIAHAWTVP